MNKLLLVITTSIGIFLLSAFTTFKSENVTSFIILQEDTKYPLEFCEKAIADGNWCGFRFQNKRNLIQFDTGLKVALFSGTEINIDNPNCILTDYRDFSTDVWRFTEDGKILRLVSKIKK